MRHWAVIWKAFGRYMEETGDALGRHMRGAWDTLGSYSEEPRLLGGLWGTLRGLEEGKLWIFKSSHRAWGVQEETLWGHPRILGEDHLGVWHFRCRPGMCEQVSEGGSTFRGGPEGGFDCKISGAKRRKSAPKAPF